MSSIADRMQLGYFPLQDYDDRTPVGIRQSIGGARIARLDDPGDADAVHSLAEVAVAQGMGTLGDVHPWMFWQVRDRANRAMGFWSQVVPALVIDGSQGGGRAPGRTGSRPVPAGVQPMRDYEMTSDIRTTVKRPGWGLGLPQIPRGALTLVLPGTEESEQHDIMAHVDPRLVAPGASGPSEAGTVVCDLQPWGELCVGGRATAGIGGREAQLQSLVRVVPLGRNKAGVLALNYGVALQGGGPGLGAIFGPVDEPDIPGIPPTKPITPRPDSSTGIGRRRTSGSDGPSFQQARRGDINTGYGAVEGGIDSGHSFEQRPVDFGEFKPQPVERHGVAFMAHDGGGGPITLGNQKDKHKIAEDADGHPINPAHIHTSALFYRNVVYDGPLYFEGLYPGAAKFPLTSEVHLAFDINTRLGNNQGFWRWFAEVPFFSPTPDPPPRRPRGGGPGRPTTPKPPIRPPTPGPRVPPTQPPSPPTTPTTPPTGGPTKPPTGGPGRPTTPGPGTGGGSGPAQGGGTTGGSSGGSGTGSTPPPGPGKPHTPGPQGPTTPRPLGPIPSAVEWVRQQQKKEAESHDPQGPPPGGGGTHPTTGPCETDPPPKEPTRPHTPPRNNASIPGGYDTRPVYTGSRQFVGSHSGLGVSQARIPHQVVGRRAGGGTRYVDPRQALGLFHDPATGAQLTVPGRKALVGDTTTSDVALYSIFHPMQETFAAIGFRPQLWVKGTPNFEHNSQVAKTVIESDEANRPQVLTARAWGAQSNGDWTYETDPYVSRARGGVTNGGVLYSPPRFEMEDYLGINSELNTEEITSQAYVAVAPGVSFALGEPSTTGGLQAKSTIIKQIPAATNTNRPLAVTQINSAGEEKELLTAELDQSSGERSVTVQGANAIVIPRGADADRPTTLLTGGMLRVSSQGANDVVEFYDEQGAAWTTLDSGGGVSDHGALTGLADDDHTQYHNDARGDARYTQRANNLSDVNSAATSRTNLGLATVSQAEAEAGTSTTTRAWTAQRVKQAIAALETSDHGNLTGLADDDHTQYLLVSGSRAMTGNLSMALNKVLLGSADEAEIFYDGNLNLVPDASGTGTIKAGSHLDFADSDKVRFGTGQDAEIYYDGSDLHIDASAVGTGKVRSESHIHLGTNTQMQFGDDSLGPLGHIKQDGTDLVLVPDALTEPVTAQVKAEGDLNVTGDYHHNGTAGITDTINFNDGDAQAHSVGISGGIITSWSFE